MSLEQATVTLVDSNDVDFGTSSNPFTSSQGAPNTVANSWPFLLTDGTDTAQIVTSSAAASGSEGLVVYLGEEDINVNISGPTTCAVTSVTVGTTVTTVLAANTARLQASFFNDGPQAVNLRLEAGATLALFTVRLTNNGYFELPYPVYTGIVTGITSVSTGTVLVTECT